MVERVLIWNLWVSSHVEICAKHIWLCFSILWINVLSICICRLTEIADEDEIKGWIPLAIKTSFDSTESLHITKVDNEVEKLEVPVFPKLEPFPLPCSCVSSAPVDWSLSQCTMNPLGLLKPDATDSSTGNVETGLRLHCGKWLRYLNGSQNRLTSH